MSIKTTIANLMPEILKCDLDKKTVIDCSDDVWNVKAIVRNDYIKITGGLNFSGETVVELFIKFNGGACEFDLVMNNIRMRIHEMKVNYSIQMPTPDQLEKKFTDMSEILIIFTHISSVIGLCEDQLIESYRKYQEVVLERYKANKAD